MSENKPNDPTTDDIKQHPAKTPEPEHELSPEKQEDLAPYDKDADPAQQPS